MLPQWIIEKKRDGGELNATEISRMITGYVGDEIPDYQMAALAMAIFFRDMTDNETAALTRCMLESGVKLDFSDISAPKIDKHSTGGVGDKISLPLAPLAAACGLAVPMIAGRGLGATGGTIDKLESIPGYRTDLESDDFKRVVRECGCSIISQSPSIAPADKRLYALRDVTGTVPSIPLIVASILSKKMAAGLDGLVLDVKWGAGAFMREYPAARKLAERLTGTARKLGLPCKALISDMNQPLGKAAGNAPEVREAIEILQGGGPPDVRELTLTLCQRMLDMAGMRSDNRSKPAERLSSGAAFDIFLRMVESQGGDPRALEKNSGLPIARLQVPVKAARTGFIATANAGLIGKACLELGAGRVKLTDQIDYAAGITGLKKIGDQVEKDEPLALLHGANQMRIESAAAMVKQAFEYSDAMPEIQPLVRDIKKTSE